MFARSLAVVGAAVAGTDSMVHLPGTWQVSQLARSFGYRMSSRKAGDDALAWMTYGRIPSSDAAPSRSPVWMRWIMVLRLMERSSIPSAVAYVQALVVSGGLSSGSASSTWRVPTVGRRSLGRYIQSVAS